MEAPGSRLPRIRVAGLIVLDGRVLLVRHEKDDRSYFLLPGGGVGWGETLTEALVREIREETGLECTANRLLIASDTIAPDSSRHVVNVVFHCIPSAGASLGTSQDPRVVGTELVDPHDLTTLDLRPPLADALQEAAADPGGFSPMYAGSLYAPENGSKS